MPSFNKVILVGNLTRDPELRYTPKDTAVAKFGLAVNRTWRTEAGEVKEEVTFIDIASFGKTAENIAEYMRKGSPLMVEGRLHLEQWEDKQTQQKRQKLGVVVETVQFLGGKQDEQQPSPRRSAQKPPPTTASDEPPPEEDDVPF